MSRRLLIDIAQLTDGHRQSLRAAAEARGFEAAFTDGGPLSDAEVYFGANGAILDAAPGLRWMSVPSAGAEQYIRPVEARGNVMLTCSVGAYGVTIAEHIIMVTLELLRRRGEYWDLVHSRTWVRDLSIRAIQGSRITLLGTGDIGRETALRLRAFAPASLVGVNRTGHAPEGVFDRVCPVTELDPVLPETDLLIMSLPATPQTRRLMDDRRLRLLPNDAYLVNVGRGGTLDQASLMMQLREGRFSGAALDVFESEPLSKEDPVWQWPNLMVTPHIAGNMTLPYTVDRIVALFLENFARYCDGQPPLRRVESGRGY